MYGQFHSVLTNDQLPAPNTGTPGDVWFVNSTGLLWFIEGAGNPIQLLTAVPIQVRGDKGDQGQQGPAGISPILSFPTETQIGGVVSTTPYGVRDTGVVVIGIDGEEIGHEWRF
jgi:hypothetical protein